MGTIRIPSFSELERYAWFRGLIYLPLGLILAALLHIVSYSGLVSLSAFLNGEESFNILILGVIILPGTIFADLLVISGFTRAF